MPSLSVLHAKRHVFDVGEFLRMAEAGVFGEDQRVELIDGEIVEMAAVGPLHAACVKRLNEALGEFGRRRYIVGVQDPVVLDDDRAVYPDLSLLRRREDFYADPPPGPGDVVLLIEVASSSLRYDRETKVPRYARACVPEVWIVDIGASRVEVYAGPVAGAYATQRTVTRGESLRSETVPGLVVGVDEVLGYEGGEGRVPS